MKITVTSILDCSPDAAWEAIQRPDLMVHISRPLLHMSVEQPHEWPARWEHGQYLVRLRLFGILPAGEQVIRIEDPEVEPPAGHYAVRDRGWGSFAHTWDHEITLAPTPDGRTLYRDRVVVGAGILTPLVAAFAQVFYRHRQRRLRRLASGGFGAVPRARRRRQPGRPAGA
jgi:hypothetical protein